MKSKNFAQFTRVGIETTNLQDFLDKFKRFLGSGRIVGNVDIGKILLSKRVLFEW